MCGRFAQFSATDILKAQFEIDALTCEVTPSYNIAPTREVLALIRHGGVRLGKLRWGLVTPWMKNRGNTAGVINARSETLSEKPAFRQALAKRRCLIPADGFFEWEKRGKRSVPYYFHLPSGQPFAFAGLYESWTDPEGQKHGSCTIITHNATGVAATVHHRMPLILNAEGRGLWLDPDITDMDRLQGILSVCWSDGLVSHRVSDVMNTVSVDGPACIEPVE